MRHVINVKSSEEHRKGILIDGKFQINSIDTKILPRLLLNLWISRVLLISLFFKFIYFNWRLITLQYCSGFCHTSTWISHRHTCSPSRTPLLPPSSSHPPGSPQCTSPEHPVSRIEPGLVVSIFLKRCILEFEQGKRYIFQCFWTTDVGRLFGKAYFRSAVSYLCHNSDSSTSAN